jgi:hypothetical protein
VVWHPSIHSLQLRIRSSRDNFASRLGDNAWRKRLTICVCGLPTGAAQQILYKYTALGGRIINGK